MNNLAGGSPSKIDTIHIEPLEYCNILYLPVYMRGQGFRIPQRIEPYIPLIQRVPPIFSYMYITIKHMYVDKGQYGNRPGWHVDGFLSDNREYVWCSREPTEYIDVPEYKEVSCHRQSLINFNKLTKNQSILTLKPNSLYSLGKTIHRTPLIKENGIRTFVKISCSSEKFNLLGNAVNELFEYDWTYYNREQIRNHPTLSNSDFVNHGSI